ncbi:MAG: chaperone NapD [Rhizobiaceae bacterium]|nr:chaperone NapD [Rhizobiaceae bacterium]MCV0408978.1 chaperone NapD [Rhizobiaceae bacterium]
MTRRDLLTASPSARHHISSAVVLAVPARSQEVARNLAAMDGVEVHVGEGSRIVITLEGPTSGMLGETLARISMMDGVLAANMVFEHVEEGEEVRS